MLPGTCRSFRSAGDAHLEIETAFPWLRARGPTARTVANIPRPVLLVDARDTRVKGVQERVEPAFGCAGGVPVVMVVVVVVVVTAFVGTGYDVVCGYVIMVLCWYGVMRVCGYDVMVAW